MITINLTKKQSIFFKEHVSLNKQLERNIFILQTGDNKMINDQMLTFLIETINRDTLSNNQVYALINHLRYNPSPMNPQKKHFTFYHHLSMLKKQLEYRNKTIEKPFQEFSMRKTRRQTQADKKNAATTGSSETIKDNTSPNVALTFALPFDDGQNNSDKQHYYGIPDLTLFQPIVENKGTKPPYCYVSPHEITPYRQNNN